MNKDLDLIIKCRRNRKVISCEECYRYKECYEGKTCEPNSFDGCLKLGYAVIGDVCIRYENCYKQGKKYACEYYKKWLCSQRPTILSAETYDGQALYDALEYKCRKKYGELDDVYKRRVENIQAKIKKYKELVAHETDIKQKNQYLQTIRKLRGDLNE